MDSAEQQVPNSSCSNSVTNVPSRKNAQEDFWYERERLTLNAIATELIVHCSHPARDKLIDPPHKWGGYFQSPLSKAVWTLDQDERSKPSFRFDERGALQHDHAGQTSYAVLNTWLGWKENDRRLAPWLNEGEPPSGELCACIWKKLTDLTLRSDRLDGQPICRLVRADQLRYDPDYQAVYQLTPAELRLIEWEQDRRHTTDSGTIEPGIAGNPLLEVRRNQSVYWQLSEAFQSLIAMFDSDLGREMNEHQRTRIVEKLVREGYPDNIEVTKGLLISK